MLIVGAALYRWWYVTTLHHRLMEQSQWILAGALTGIGILIAILIAGRGFRFQWMEFIRHPSAKTRALIALVLTLLSARYFLFTAVNQGRHLIPGMHDEYMYLLQARFLVEGHLWLPAHPLNQFFETFHVLTKPVYAPIYFFGTALVYAPGTWAGLPPFLTSILVAGGCIGIMYLVVTHLLDGMAGLLAALLLASLPFLHSLSILAISHSIMLLLALLMVWAYIGWRKNLREPQRPLWKMLAWGGLLGFFAGFAADTRPIDALCYAVPLAVAILLDLRRAPRLALWTLPVALLMMAPFFALQLIANHGITGHWLQDPASLYASIYWPALRFGLPRPDPNFRPPTSLPQIQEYYRFIRAILDVYSRDHIWQAWYQERWRILGGVTVPMTLLLLPACVGVLALFHRGIRSADRQPRRLWIMPVAYVLFAAIYTAYPSFMDHYAIVVAPAMILLVLLGCSTLTAAAGLKYRPSIKLILGFLIIGASCGTIHEINPNSIEAAFDPVLLKLINERLAKIRPPALVFFRCSPKSLGALYHAEPVYNIDTANPDDSQIIRAHDLGWQEDQKLCAYYAFKDPERAVYLFRYDVKLLKIETMGTVAHPVKIPDMDP